MTITAADLTYPRGELQRTWFPDGDLAANLAVWIDEADTSNLTSTTDVDNAVRAYAYARAYETVAGRLAALPTTEQSNDYRTTYGPERIQFFVRQGQRWRTVYDGILASKPIQQQRPASSSSAAARAAW